MIESNVNRTIMFIGGVVITLLLIKSCVDNYEEIKVFFEVISRARIQKY